MMMNRLVWRVRSKKRNIFIIPTKEGNREEEEIKNGFKKI